MSAVNRSATALACTIDAPGARRALRNAEWLPRCVSWSCTSGCSWLIIWTGTKTAGAMPFTIPVYDAGATPTIVYSRPDKRIVRPTADGSLANVRCQ